MHPVWHLMNLFYFIFYYWYYLHCQYAEKLKTKSPEMKGKLSRLQLQARGRGFRCRVQFDERWWQAASSGSTASPRAPAFLPGCHLPAPPKKEIGELIGVKIQFILFLLFNGWTAFQLVSLPEVVFCVEAEGITWVVGRVRGEDKGQREKGLDKGQFWDTLMLKVIKLRTRLW